jgi:hypothetical protein
VPASRLSGLSESARAALVQRLGGQRADGDGDPAVALLPAADGLLVEVQDAGDALATAGAIDRGAAGARDGRRPNILLGGTGPQELETLRAAEAAGARIVVAQQGMKAARLVAAVHHYERLGLEPQWVLLVRKASRSRRRAVNSDAVPSWTPADQAASDEELLERGDAAPR